MDDEKRLAICLLILRVSVFFEGLLWALSKIFRPDQALKMFSAFYHINALPMSAYYVVGLIQVVVLLAFLIGFKKTMSYSLVALLQLVAALAPYNQYLQPFSGPNILFFAAWPTFAACLTLFMMREFDVLLIWKKKKQGR